MKNCTSRAHVTTLLLAVLFIPVAAAQSLMASAMATAAVAATAMAQQAAAALAPAGAKVLAQAGTIDPRLQLAPCNHISPYLSPGVPVWGKTRVGLRCVDGASWNVSLPMQVQVWAPAWVAHAALPAGTALDGSQLQVASVDWAAAPSPPLVPKGTVELGSRVLARPLQAGQALRVADLVPRRWFVQGDTVQVHAVGQGFAISTEGQALTPGLEGQSARVRTENGRVVIGQPVGERRMELRL